MLKEIEIRPDFINKNYRLFLYSILVVIQTAILVKTVKGIQAQTVGCSCLFECSRQTGSQVGKHFNRKIEF
jgi:hypothetical protein